jgi:Skp family chaperone for outer membrane proteins
MKKSAIVAAIVLAMAVLGASSGARADPQEDLSIAIGEFNSGQCDTAVYHFTQMLQQDGVMRQQGASTYTYRITPVSKANLYLWRGKAELCQGHLTEAVHDADTALAVAPDSPLTSLIIGLKNQVKSAMQATAVCAFDLDRIQKNVTIMQDAAVKLRQVVSPLQAEAKAETAALGELSGALARDRPNLAPADYGARYRELEARRTADQAKFETFRWLIDETRTQLMYQVFNAIGAANGPIMKAHGCAPIPEMAKWPGVALPRFETSDEVIARVNAANPAIDMNQVNQMVEIAQRRRLNLPPQ